MTANSTDCPLGVQVDVQAALRRDLARRLTDQLAATSSNWTTPFTGSHGQARGVLMGKRSGTVSRASGAGHRVFRLELRNRPGQLLLRSPIQQQTAGGQAPAAHCADPGVTGILPSRIRAQGKGRLPRRRRFSPIPLRSPHCCLEGPRKVSRQQSFGFPPTACAPNAGCTSSRSPSSCTRSLSSTGPTFRWRFPP